MPKYDYLAEMQVRFANPRLKEFVGGIGPLEKCAPNMALDEDKRVGLADYIFRKSLLMTHKSWLRIEAILKSENVSGSTLAIHYDTLVLQLMTWIRFSIDSLSVEKIVAGAESDDDNPNSVVRCLGLSSAMSQMLMNELMASGDDTGGLNKIDRLIKDKVDSAFEKNQTLLINWSREGKECKAMFAYILVHALKRNSDESTRFVLEKWDLTSSDKKQILEKLNPLKDEDEKKIGLIFFQVIKMLEPEINDLYEEALKLHATIF